MQVPARKKRLQQMNRQRTAKEQYFHKVALEEVLQLPLSCRVGKVADVQAATFSCAGKDSVVVGLAVLGLASQ